LVPPYAFFLAHPFPGGDGASVFRRIPESRKVLNLEPETARALKPALREHSARVSAEIPAAQSKQAAEERPPPLLVFHWPWAAALRDRASISACQAFNIPVHPAAISRTTSDSGTTAEESSSNSIMPIPNEIRGQSYISLTTFRKSGIGVPTPVWFGEKDGKMYVMARPDSGKVKRIRNNPQVRIAPSTIRGRVTGPEFSAKARILPQSAWADARKLINQKYWMARIPFLWSKDNVYLELEAS